MKIPHLVLVGLLLLGFTGCKEKPEENRVDFDQINVDNSNDYRYIFQEEIQKEESRNKKYRKKEF